MSANTRPVRTRTTCAGSADRGQVRDDLVGRVVTVRLGEALDELVGPDRVLLGADGLQDQGGQECADLGAALQDTAQECVQVASEELLELDELEIAQNLAQNTIDLAETSAWNGSFNGR